MSILKKYQEAIASGKILKDENQQAVIIELQKIYENIEKKSPKNFLSNFIKKNPIKGLYLSGPVGAGKTWIMDLFYHSLTVPKKRFHFHAFMHEMHQRLKQMQGQEEPLKRVVKFFFKDIKIICFDEFLVNDIGDAMILAGILKAIFEQGITLVATSNTIPDELYKNGLQRQRFLPAIELIKKHMTVMSLMSKQDYRLRALEQAGVYHYPLNEEANEKMWHHFIEFTDNHFEKNKEVLIADRLIPTLAIGERVIWFDFNVLCQIPRSQIDYLEISQQFDVVLLSNVPQLGKNKDNQALYLIHLVDVLYDAKIKLILSAEVSVSSLYLDGRWKIPFQRTISRLTEMQSHEYLRNFS